MITNILKSNREITNVSGYVIRNFTRNEIVEYNKFKIHLNNNGVAVVQIKRDLFFIFLNNELQLSDLQIEIEHLLYRGGVQVRTLEEFAYNFEERDTYHVLPAILYSGMIYSLKRYFGASYNRKIIEFCIDGQTFYRFQFQFLFDNVFNAYIILDPFLSDDQEIITARERLTRIQSIKELIHHLELEIGSFTFKFSENITFNI